MVCTVLGHKEKGWKSAANYYEPLRLEDLCAFPPSLFNSFYVETFLQNMNHHFLLIKKFHSKWWSMEYIYNKILKIERFPSCTIIESYLFRNIRKIEIKIISRRY